jgi:hypothetical protein
MKMIPSNLEERRKMINYMLTSCVESKDELTKWEQNFIASIEGQFETKSNLSDRQCEILEQIYDKL